MLESKYKNDFKKQYIVIKSKEKGIQHSYKDKMIESNQIQGVLPFHIRVEDTEMYYYYDISNKKKFNQQYQQHLFNYEEISKILQEIVDIIQRAANYLLCGNDFVVNIDYLFFDPTDNALCLCYVSGYDESLFHQLHELLEFFLAHINYDDQRAVSITYQLYQLTNQDNCNINSIMEILKKDSNELKEKKCQQSIEDMNQISYEKQYEQVTINNKTSDLQYVQKKKEKSKWSYAGDYLIIIGIVLLSIVVFTLLVMGGILNNNFGHRLDYVKVVAVLFLLIVFDFYISMKIMENSKRLKREKPKKVKTERMEPKVDYVESCSQTVTNYKMPMQQVMYDRIDDFDEPETTLLLPEEENCTMVLDCPFPKKAILRNQNGNQKEEIVITSFPFRIGKIKGQVDFQLPYKTISRFHAEFSCDDEGQVYIQDLQSKNGTFINGKQLCNNQKYKLNNGDQIAFANQLYIVEI